MPRLRLRALALATLVTVLTAVLDGCGGFSQGAYSLPLPGGPDLGQHPYTVRIHFADVEQLVPKSLVKVHDVPVGEVQRISVDPKTWTAVVVAELNRSVHLPANARANVRRTSLLGESYVALAGPTGKPAAKPLAKKASVPVGHTGASAPIEAVLGALSMLLNGGGLPQINTIVTELNHALAGNEPQLRGLLRNLDSLVARLDASRDDITRALDGLGQLAHTLNGQRHQLRTALDQLPQGVKVLAEQRKQLVGMLHQLDRLSKVTVNVVHQSQADTVADLKALKPTLTKLQQAGRDLPKSLKLLATFPFTPGAEDAIKGDYVNLKATVDLNLANSLNNLTRSNQPVNIGGIEVPNPLAILQGKQAPHAGQAHGKHPAKGPSSGSKSPPANSSGPTRSSGPAHSPGKTPSPDQPHPHGHGLPELLGTLTGGGHS